MLSRNSQSLFECLSPFGGLSQSIMNWAYKQQKFLPEDWWAKALAESQSPENCFLGQSCFPLASQCSSVRAITLICPCCAPPLRPHFHDTLTVLLQRHQSPLQCDLTSSKNLFPNMVTVSGAKWAPGEIMWGGGWWWWRRGRKMEEGGGKWDQELLSTQSVLFHPKQSSGQCHIPSSC